jgi:hypothetical protein
VISFPVSNKSDETPLVTTASELKARSVFEKSLPPDETSVNVETHSIYIPIGLKFTEPGPKDSVSLLDVEIELSRIKHHLHYCAE